MTGQQLKNSILQEAIQGRLVQQCLEDEPASVVFDTIQQERNRRINDGRLKKEKTSSFIPNDEIPFEIPKSWKWVRVQDLFNVRSALRIHQTDWRSEGVPFFRGRELVQLANTGTTTPEIFISRELYESNKNKGGVPKKNDLLISAVGTIGKVYIVQGTREFYYKDAYILCFENYANTYVEYIKYALESPYLQEEIHRDSMATTVAQLTIQKAKSLLIPLPPIEEQKRIVKKIDELLPLVDEYNKAAGELEELNKTLPDKLRKSMLQEAIHGTLVSNEIPKGEASAPELLQQILKERQEKENKEKGKKAKKLALSETDDDLDDLPDGWCWCKLSDIGDCLYGVSESAKTAGPYKLLRITDIQNDSVHWETVPLSDYKKKDVAKYYLIDGDLVFARTGGTVGKSYLIQDAPANAIYASYLIRVRFQGKVLLPKYIKYFFQSPQYWSQIIESSEGTGQPNCNGTKLANLNIPLPPLSIQRRIVEKIEEVFSSIDKLTTAEEQ